MRAGRLAFVIALGGNRISLARRHPVRLTASRRRERARRRNFFRLVAFSACAPVARMPERFMSDNDDV